ncbi:MAG TPA: sigma 54-interacting transcriptional regulator [Candidatus Solibacter sp.]|nr:sigma 54-interacting transcriptional regulator [Candidatus Solibacter sp.]
MPSNAAFSGAGKVLPFDGSEVLIESEQLLAAYFSSRTVGLCLLDSSLRYVVVNDALAAMNGFPAGEHLGKTVRQLLGSIADQLEPLLQRVLETGEAADFELSGPLATRLDNGHWIAHYIPIKDETGDVTRVGAVVLETTAQKKLENSLNSISRKLSHETNISQLLTDATVILSANWDLERMFRQLSARLRRVFRQELAGLALHGDDRGDDEQMLDRQILDFPLGRGSIGDFIFASNGPAAHALQARTPAIFSKEQLKALDVEISRGVSSEGLQSLCCVPLLRPSGSLGVLALGSTRKNAFHLEALGPLQQVGTQLALAVENQLALQEVEVLKQRLSVERRFLDGETASQSPFTEIVGESPALKEVLDQAATVAASGSTVLLLGETGTGKELVARAIHRMSDRHAGPFVKVNCAAIPTGLLESELFGHEKGAFTGAISQKVGRMELASGGTLLLDEIGEIALELQPKLLRVLQDQEFERLGSNRTIKVNLRVLAATNRNLKKEVAEQKFRSDLYYRLNVFPIRIPPLRERREDIPSLVRHFVRKFALRMNRQIESVPTETMDALIQWPWPGNVRELENLMERSVILTEGSALRVPLSDLRAEALPDLVLTDNSLDAAEREHIIRVLRESGGLLSGPDGAARRLGLKRTTLQSKMLRLNITRKDYIGPKV